MYMSTVTYIHFPIFGSKRFVILQLKPDFYYTSLIGNYIKALRCFCDEKHATKTISFLSPSASRSIVRWNHLALLKLAYIKSVRQPGFLSGHPLSSGNYHVLSSNIKKITQLILFAQLVVSVVIRQSTGSKQSLPS